MKLNKFLYLMIGSPFLLLGGCGTLNNTLSEKTQHVEYYHIFDVQTDASRQAVMQAASDGIGRNVSNVTEDKPIPNFSSPPEKPGRFKIVNPFKGTNMAALAAMGGQSMKVAQCDGAVWIAHARREENGNGDMDITLCLFQYAKGYNLDMYAGFTKKEGGFMQIARAGASALVGTPEEWANKTFMDVVKEIEKDTHAKIIHLEGQPSIKGTPWIDG